MTFASLFPELVYQLVSLDAPPIDRLLYPHLNKPTESLIDAAYAIGDLSHIGMDGARKYIDKNIEDPVLKQALLFNLEEDASWSCNMRAIYRNKKDLFTYHNYGTFEGPTLFLNGAQSYQREIQDDILFYKNTFPNANAADLIQIEDAGHGLHFD